MKPLSVNAVGLALLLPAVLTADDRKDDKAAKLLGTWERNTTNRDVIFSFNKDGKLVLAQKDSDGTELKFGGTYKVEGDKLIYVVHIFIEDLSRTETIEKLTDNELTLVDRDGEVTSFKKIPSPAGAFELTCPPGTEVHDSRDGKTYLVQPDGSFRLVPEPWYVRNRWLLYAVLISVAVVVCVLYTLKKRLYS
jgi:uncharacterized protein (TIGR03066 family)